jgi:hypothetical protein
LEAKIVLPLDIFRKGFPPFPDLMALGERFVLHIRGILLSGFHETSAGRNGSARASYSRG